MIPICLMRNLRIWEMLCNWLWDPKPVDVRVRIYTLNPSSKQLAILPLSEDMDSEGIIKGHLNLYDLAKHGRAEQVASS